MTETVLVSNACSEALFVFVCYVHTTGTNQQQDHNADDDQMSFSTKSE
ncbi:MAG: hypothetical protein U9N81_03215 [Bacillota bacterium]|nr:hypothetical protein [Bacillota bacterium]